MNDAPVTVAAAATTAEDTPLTGTLTATDVDSADAHVPCRRRAAAHGTLVLDPAGSFTYSPAPDFNGADSFAFAANDGALDSNVSTVSLTVSAVNDAPVAQDQSVAMDEGTVLLGTLVAADVDSVSLTYIFLMGDVYGSCTSTRPGRSPIPRIRTSSASTASRSWPATACSTRTSER